MMTLERKDDHYDLRRMKPVDFSSQACLRGRAQIRSRTGQPGSQSKVLRQGSVKSMVRGLPSAFATPRTSTQGKQK
jgi:hypothetical protein